MTKTWWRQTNQNDCSDRCNPSHGKCWEDSLVNTYVFPFKGLDVLLVYEEVEKLVDNGWTSDSPVLVRPNLESLNFALIIDLTTF